MGASVKARGEYYGKHIETAYSVDITKIMPLNRNLKLDSQNFGSKCPKNDTENLNSNLSEMGTSTIFKTSNLM